jgi:amyloid beta precursor protein binding protein 1
VADLRVKAPWPALRAAVDALDLRAADDMALRHVPYLVLLIKALDAFKAAHGGAEPASAADKAAFRAQLAALGRADAGGDRAVRIRCGRSHIKIHRSGYEP